MHEWLEWARGPVFRFAFLFMVLGLLRLFVLNLFGLYMAKRRAGDKHLPIGKILLDTAAWLFPATKISKDKLVFMLVSALFHVALIVTPIFLGAHILLWKRGINISWPALSNHVADVLTLVAIACGVFIVAHRLFSKTARALSRFQDYALLLLVVATFVSGYLAMHPETNPFLYETTMFVHVMTGNLIFVSLPFSKLSHAMLFPMGQAVSELGWHLAPGAGRHVASVLGKDLGKEQESV